MNYLEIRNGIEHLRKNDKTLRRIIDENEICNLSRKRNYFIQLLKAIIGQQLSYYAAKSINGKFLNFFEGKPTPEKVWKVEDSLLRSLGLSNAKTKYVKDLSLKLMNNEISLKNISSKSDGAIIEELTKVKGIGVWTSQMFLIFTLARLDVLPFDDLSLRKAIMKNYGLKHLPVDKEINRISNKHNWAPYRSIASWYLWRSMDN